VILAAILGQADMPQPAIHEWVYVLALALPAAIAAAAAVFQGRKTRKRGTEEHVLGRELLIQHGEALSRLESKADRTIEKVDRIDNRVTRIERDAKIDRDDAEHGLLEASVKRAEILDRVVDHVDAPLGGIREGA
jgi:hypothetical protein